jgi:hypothetical protein
MGKPLPIKQIILRGWRTGTCRFSDVLVNEHPLIEGRIVEATGDLEHHDSPDLHHWFDKQNRYTTQEALIRFRKMPMAAHPKLFGSKLERRIWLKKYFFIIPFRYKLYFIINIFLVKTWRTGRIGFTWARLRVWVRRSIEDKLAEMNNTGQEMILPVRELGKPHPSVRQMD